ncbi:MAG: hypothetical protein ACRDRL_31860 [Sciscionella sp.]
MSQYNTPGGGEQSPPPGAQHGPWETVSGPSPVPPAPPSGPDEPRRSHTRVAVTIAALVATLGAIVGGFVLTSGNGSAPTSHNTSAGDLHAVVDPPSVSAAPSLSVPPAPATPDKARAQASALAAGKAFVPPTTVPADVPGYSGSAPLEAIILPPFLTVSIPGIQAKDQAAQGLADQSVLMLKAWAEAWASGNVDDARYRTLCVAQCRAVLDPTISLWKKADIIPAGALRFFLMAGGLGKNSATSGVVGVCLDDSALKAFRGGVTYADPYPLGAPELLVFGLVYDKAVAHWVATEAYTSPGDSYCTDSGGGTSG